MTSADRSTALDDELIRHAKLLGVLRQRIAQRMPAGVDLAALGVLRAVIASEPTRQSELAEALMLDPSTTSRYVAQLTKAGLVQRQSHPDDGRAVQLRITDAGTALADLIATQRRSVLDEVLAGFSAQELAQLCQLIRKLNDAIDDWRTTSTSPLLQAITP